MTITEFIDKYQVKIKSVNRLARRADIEQSKDEYKDGYHLEINLKCADREMVAYYSMGSLAPFFLAGRSPLYQMPKTVYQRAENRAKTDDIILAITRNNRSFHAKLLEDVIDSLKMDGDVLSYDTFEQWADSCGYDTDSRKAEKIYLACKRAAFELKALLGQDGFKDLLENTETL